MEHILRCSHREKKGIKDKFVTLESAILVFFFFFFQIILLLSLFLLFFIVNIELAESTIKLIKSKINDLISSIIDSFLKILTILNTMHL